MRISTTPEQYSGTHIGPCPRDDIFHHLTTSNSSELRTTTRCSSLSQTLRASVLEFPEDVHGSEARELRLFSWLHEWIQHRGTVLVQAGHHRVPLATTPVIQRV